MQTWMASAHGLAVGPFLFWADHLVFEGHAFGVILRKPGFRSILIGEDLDVLGVANLSG